MFHAVLFLLAGYLSGSVLYARVFSSLLRRGDVTEKSRDGNPGTANAFLYGGFWCGALTLSCELLKGFVPVWLFTHCFPGPPPPEPLASLILAAPVIGHVLPVFFHFQGGKGIAVTFGCLLGFWPQADIFWLFAAFFILFSTVLRICPHFYRTIVTYLCTAAAALVKGCANPGGFLISAVVVIGKLLTSKEKREKCQVKLLWMR